MFTQYKVLNSKVRKSQVLWNFKWITIVEGKCSFEWLKVLSLPLKECELIYQSQLCLTKLFRIIWH